MYVLTAKKKLHTSLQAGQPHFIGVNLDVSQSARYLQCLRRAERSLEGAEGLKDAPS